MKYKYLSTLLLVGLVSCSTNKFAHSSGFFSFNTRVEINFNEGSNEDLQEIERIIKYYDKLTDNYSKRDINNVYTINTTNEEVEINEDLYKLLKTSFNAKNEGAYYFNPLCGSLSKKWKESLAKKEVLSDLVIGKELEKIDNSSLIFLDNNIVKRMGEAEIDLGAIAKGYCLDIIKDYLVSKEINQYIISAGSSSILLGEKNSEDKFYSVELNDIKGTYFMAKNCFVSTSGTSEQGVKINNVTYSHIINPYTGSAINEHDAVIVINDKGYLGDALSTSLMMNTVDEIKKIENDLNIKTIVIKDKKIIYHHPEIEVLHR